MKIRTLGLSMAVAVFSTLLYLPSAANAQEKAWWPAEVELALARAKDNRPEMVKALQGVPAEHRPAMVFLLANMPDSDLRSLKGDFLLENVDLAYKVRQQAAWTKKIPEETFLNNVLPYANVDESRHPWRKELYDLCWPIVKDCKTAAEAAQKLNETVFNHYKVKYSTQRKKANQSPKESIDTGLASCTGLSILLIDACRSVGIPARLVGTALWVDRSGNHNWVEIWDGAWHFTGACEPDPKGLDRGWFEQKAGQAIKDSTQHAIFAVSFKKTEISFPLVWSKQRKDVYAENVTDFYVQNAKDKKELEAPTQLPKEKAQQIEKDALLFFSATAAEQAKWQFDGKLDQMLAANEAAVRAAVWKAFLAAPIHSELKKQFDAHEVRYKEHLSPYVVRKVGERPNKGWPLIIAMHGGGNAPKSLNDSQWKSMQKYYKDQPALGGYQYLALRAPNDTWNGFYDEYVPPLIMNLIRQFVVLGDVDPDKVYIIGYSHGGYGAFFIGPKIPDRFAAIHCSASAPTDGTISPLTLRNTRFTFMVGGKDTAYGRLDRCEQFSEVVEKLKKENPGAFPVEFEFKPGVPHSGLPDKDKIKDLYPHTRNAVPHRLQWVLGDSVLTDFFWLSVAQPAKHQAIDVSLEANKAAIATSKVGEMSLCLDSRLVDFSKSLQIVLNGKTTEQKIAPSFLTLCQSIQKRGDPSLACTCQVQLDGQDQVGANPEMRLFDYQKK